MNEQQKEFTQEEITNYQAEVDDLYFKINRSALFAFCGLGVAISIFAIDGEISGIETLDNFVGVMSGATTIINATSAVKNICRRASLEHTIRMLEHNLAMDELSEDKPKQYTKK